MKRFYYCYLLVCLFLCFLLNSCNSKERVINVESFGISPDSGEDASRAVRMALDYCREHNVDKLVFPKGRYDFYPDYTYEKLMYISNNNDGVKSVAFLMEDMKNFELDGQGSEFIFHGYICPFILQNSSDISFKNFSVDYARTFHSEGLITNVGKDYIEVSFSDLYPYQIENERLKFYDHEKKRSEYPFGNLLEFDPVKKETAFKVRDYYIGNNIKAEETPYGDVRVYVDGITATKGNIMVFAPNHRLCPAITVDASKNVCFENIKLYHSGGMGIIAQMSTDIFIDKMECTLSPYYDRVVSCTADATHFSNCDGKIEITNSLFRNQMDDATNIHGIFMRVDKITGSKSLLLRLVHYEQLGMNLFSKGDILEFVDSETVQTYGHGKVKSVTQLNKDLTEIEFEENLPEGMKEKDVVGATKSPDVLIKNCTIIKNRARGILLGSRDQIVVEGNLFHTSGASILTGGDTQYWFEQGGVSNMTIRNNVFDNCLFGDWGNAVIQLDAGLAKGEDNAPRFNQNILIENNEFRCFDPRLLHVNSVDGLVFKNNKIVTTDEYPQQNMEAQPFVVTHSRNVNIESDDYFTYQNPLNFSYPYFDGKEERTITELRDPCIMRDGDTYYLVFTHYPFTHHTSKDAGKPDMNSSPGIRLYSSKDLKNWKFENWLVKSSELPEDCPYKHRFWAPEIRKMNGKYYIIFYADNWIKDEYNSTGEVGYVGFVGVADKPTGPYEHITWLEGTGCDSHLFADTDGKMYSVMPFGDTFLQEADLSGIEQQNIKLLGKRKVIVNRDNRDIKLNFSPDYMEAPWMIKRNGKYVLFTGSPYKKEQQPERPDLELGYWVGVAMADNIWGPYTKQPQLFLGGHIAVFEGPDGKEWFSYRGESGGKQQGLLCIDPIPFEEDGSVKAFKPSTELVSVKR